MTFATERAAFADELKALDAIETGEKAAIEKFDAVLNHPAIHADHIEMMKKQHNELREALRK